MKVITNQKPALGIPGTVTPYAGKLKPKIRGLGDLVKTAAGWFRIPQCGGCRQRQEDWNKLWSFGKEKK